MNPVGVKRLQRELAKMMKNPDPMFAAMPHEDDLTRWYFVIRGPEGTVYEGGIYMGIIFMDNNYPFKAPDIQMITPNGRLWVGKNICFNGFTAFHAESWGAGWTVRSMVLGVQSFMFDEKNPRTYGCVYESKSKRKKLAKESHTFNSKQDVYNAYFSTFKDSIKDDDDDTPPEKKRRVEEDDDDDDESDKKRRC